MNKRHYEHTLPNIRGSLSNTYIGFTHVSCHIFSTFQSLQVKKPPTRRIRIDGFLFPVQIQCPLPVIEHLIVVVGGNPDSVSFLEEPAFGHVQAHNVLLSFSR